MSELKNGIMMAKVLKQIMDSIRQSVVKEFKEMNLTGPQGMLVGILSRHGAMKVSELSERLGLSNSTVSGIVDRLEKQGYVERTRSQEDRRVVRVDITDGFKKTSKSQFEKVENKLASILDDITEEEATKISEGLNLLKEVMERKTTKE